MSASPIETMEPLRSPRAFRRIRALLGTVGAPTVLAARWLAFVAGLGAAVAVHAVRRTTWRRPVRLAFLVSLREAGPQALPAVLVAAVLVGFGMVFQALYWLGTFGQEALVGRVLTTVLVREVAPVIVGLLLVGRSGTSTLIELGTLAREGQVAALDARGIDPLLLLVLPRVLAFAVAGFCLTVIFVAAALVAGWLASYLLTRIDLGLLQFLDDLLRAMGASNFVLLPLKGITIGIVVALVACAVPLASARLAAHPTRLVPQGFALMVLATLVVSGLVSMVL